MLAAGNVRLRATNQGYIGKLSTDPASPPAAQWPGLSGVEFLGAIHLAVAANDPFQVDPALLRRTSYSTEWQPPTLSAEDSIRSALAGAPGSERFFDDDGDTRVDEEFLDGRDNDFDGMIDEDYAAIGDQMLAWTMRDDTAPPGPLHIPLNLECTQRVWAFNRPGFSDFAVIEYTIRNVSGHTLDSLAIGWMVDLSCGPKNQPGGYANDDVTLPVFPSGSFLLVPDPSDPRRQHPHDPALNSFVPAESVLCPRFPVRARGFSVADVDGDNGSTPAIATFLVVDHTIDATGLRAPQKVGLRAFRHSVMGTPPGMGGLPTTDGSQYLLMTGTQGVDPFTGMPNAALTGVVGDQVAMCSVGPFLQVEDGRSIQATIAVAVQTGNYPTALQYQTDRFFYENGFIHRGELFQKYPSAEVVFNVGTALEGDNVPAPSGFPVPDLHGREVSLIAPIGEEFEASDCRDLANESTRTVHDDRYTWFDFDCDFCTGVYDYPSRTGLLHRSWTLPPSLLIGAEPAPSGMPIRVGQVMPNPARGNSRVDLDLPRAHAVTAAIYDVSGRQVREVVNAMRPAGGSQIVWDGRDGGGREVPPGLYYLYVRIGEESVVRKVIRVH